MNAATLPNHHRQSDGTVTGADVLALRLKLGLGQEKFAHRLGVCVGTVNRWENGKCRVSQLAAKALEALANAVPR